MGCTSPTISTEYLLDSCTALLFQECCTILQSLFLHNKDRANSRTISLGPAKLKPGVMDTTGFARDHYYLRKQFSMPHRSGPKNAISVEKSQEVMLIAAYTIMVKAILLGWWMMITMMIPTTARWIARAHKRGTKLEVVRVVEEWQIIGPFEATYNMGKFCWGMINFHSLFNRRPDTLQGQNGAICTLILGPRATKRPPSWSNLYVGSCILLLALGSAVGAIVGAIFLPNYLVIGHVAPVNDRMVLWSQPSVNSVGMVGDGKEWNIISKDWRDIRLGVVLGQRGPSRAIANVDSMALTSKLKQLVTVVKDDIPDITNQPPLPHAEPGVQNYTIGYSYKINGTEMGLQHLGSLEAGVVGNCSFQYTWFKRTNRTTVTGMESIYGPSSGRELFDDEYELYPAEQGSRRHWIEYFSGPNFLMWAPGPMLPQEKVFTYLYPRGNNITAPHRFAILPGTQGMDFATRGHDPWYHGQSDEQSGWWPQSFNARGIPPLACDEQMTWSHRGSQLGLDTVIAGANARWREGDHGYSSLDDPKVSALLRSVPIPRGVWEVLCRTFHQPLLVSVLEGIAGRRLESGTRYRDAISIDAERASAYTDIERLVRAAYLLGRNRFRDAALAYVDPELSREARFSNNVLRADIDGFPVPGAGDFVLPSEDVTTLDFGLVVAVPTVLLLCWVIVAGLWWLNGGAPGHASAYTVAALGAL